MGLMKTFPRELCVTIGVTICVTNLEFSSLYYQKIRQGHQASFICPDQKEKRVLSTKFTELERDTFYPTLVLSLVYHEYFIFSSPKKFLVCTQQSCPKEGQISFDQRMCNEMKYEEMLNKTQSTALCGVFLLVTSVNVSVVTETKFSIIYIIYFVGT